MFDIDGSTILVDGKKIYEAPTLVRKTLPYQDKLIVLYLWPDEELDSIWDTSDNLVCIDRDDNEIWKIEADLVLKDIKFDHDNIVWGVNLGGWYFRIEPHNGQVSAAEYCIIDSFKIVGSRVSHDGKDIFDAPGEVTSSIVTQDKNLIILFSGESHNVICLDFNGAVKWRVQPVKALQDVDGYSRWNSKSFRGLSQQEGKIYLENYSDAKFEINPNTGEILSWNYL